jgi:SAM-dependent methyltransferase
MGLTSYAKRFVKPDSRVGRAGRIVKRELRSRAERRSRTGINLNVGSGHQEIPGFTSLDLDSDWYRARGRKFLEYNMIEDSLPCADGTVDNIYCSHVIEHLPNDVVLRFLNEAHRVLRDGGTLRIACPDAEFLWEVSSFSNDFWGWREPWFSSPVYSSDPESKPRRSDFFVREIATPNCALYRYRRNSVDYDDSIFDSDFDTALKSVSTDLAFLPDFPGDHINAWTFAKLRNFAESVGFTKIVRSKRGASVSKVMQHEDFDRTGPNMSLYADIVKG